MIISVDHGNKSIKTPNALFTSGLISSEGLQGFKTDYICWNGRYYTLTEQRISYLRDKTEDERFYIVLAVLSFGAQLEVDTKSKAQAEGIAAAHLKGVKFGRPKCSVKDWDIYYPKWKQGEITAVECYRQLGVSASTFYRLVHKFESEEKAR